MSPWWRTTRLVIGRELLVGFRRKSYRLTVVLLIVGGLAVGIVPRLLSSGDTPEYTVAVVGRPPPGFATALAAVERALDLEVKTRTAPGRAAAEEALAGGDADAALLWPAGADRGDDTEPPSLLQEKDTSTRLLAAVSNAAVASSTTVRLEAAGVAPERAATVLASPPVAETVAGEASEEEKGVGYAVVFVLYLFIVTAGTQVATGVATEKTNRIAESLLATVRASQLLAGKVIGIGVLGFVALCAVVVPVTASLLLGGDLDVPTGATGQVVAGVGWFVLGYTLYACAYAALGALVERQEEVGGAVMPLTMALVVTYLVSAQAQGDPDSTLAVVGSLFPLTAPMVMPTRTAVGAAGGFEIAVSVLGVAATAAALVRVGSVVYRRAIIRTGRRLKLREVLRRG